MRVHQIPGGECQKLRNWDTKLTSQFVCSYQNCFNYLAGMPADVWVSLHDPTAHVQGFSCQKREAGDCDIILVMSKLSAYVEGGKYIRGSAHEFKAILWVFGSHTFW